MILPKPKYVDPHYYSPVWDGVCPSQVVYVCALLWGPKYPDEFAITLYNMVKRNLRIPFRFVLFTDRPYVVVNEADVDQYGMNRLGLDKLHVHSWWYKVGMFNNVMFGMDATVLFLDLDMVIVNDITWMVGEPMPDEPLVMVENFAPNRHYCMHNSSVMRWTNGDGRLDPILTQFSPRVVQELHGDQDWIQRALPGQIVNWPRHEVLSYKYDNDMFDVNHASIMLFHGEPKQDKCGHLGYVKEHWR